MEMYELLLERVVLLTNEYLKIKQELKELKELKNYCNYSAIAE